LFGRRWQPKEKEKKGIKNKMIKTCLVDDGGKKKKKKKKTNKK